MAPAKGSEEAKAWAARMVAARAAKKAGRQATEHPVVNEGRKEIKKIKEGMKAARAKKAAKKAAPVLEPEERIRMRDALAARMKAAKEGQLMAPAKSREEPSFASEEIKEVDKKAPKPKEKKAKKAKKEEAPASKPEVKEKETLAAARKEIKELRKKFCPPVAKMRKPELLHELKRLLVKEGETPEENLEALTIDDLRAVLKAKRAKHCPPISKMRKPALLAELKELKERAGHVEKSDYGMTTADVKKAKRKEAVALKKKRIADRTTAKKLEKEGKMAEIRQLIGHKD